MTVQPARWAKGLAGVLATTALLFAGSACADDQLILSANGSTLTGTSGGEGGSLNYLHDMTHAVIGVGGEYQKLATAHWAFGSLTGTLRGNAADTKWTLDGEVHRGAGAISEAVGTHRFDYGVEALGASGTFFNRVTLQVESRQFDIDTTRGNLPKIGLGVLWARSWLTTVSYARSVSGNLGTELETLRIDRYGRLVNFVAGGAAGHVAPPVVNIQTGALGPAPQYREGYVGFSRKFTRVDVGILGDYLSLAGTHRITLTLTFSVHLGSPI
ncbi:MAG TPA: hypothetical protein VN730_13635 [Steroidobacteraceae bacterium]|nr:hypothetical protein [Steroidobacteraceae bacterium]